MFDLSGNAFPKFINLFGPVWGRFILLDLNVYTLASQRRPSSQTFVENQHFYNMVHPFLR